MIYLYVSLETHYSSCGITDVAQRIKNPAMSGFGGRSFSLQLLFLSQNKKNIPWEYACTPPNPQNNFIGKN